MSTPIEDAWQKAKAWFTSKTIIGAIIGIVGMVISLIFPDAGINLQDKVDIVLEDGTVIAQQADIAYGAILTLWGLMQAIYGRIVAKQPVA